MQLTNYNSSSLNFWISTFSVTFPPPFFFFFDLRRCKSCTFLLWSLSHFLKRWLWFMSRLIALELWELNFFRSLHQYLQTDPLFSTSGYFIPNSVNKALFFFAKVGCRTGFRSDIEWKAPISKCACKQINKQIIHSLERHCLDMHWKKHDSVLC